jgi:hypothetical protein
MIVAAVASCQIPTTSVEVVNGRDAPVPVLEQKVLQPVHNYAGKVLKRGERAVTLDLVTPPEGKMVVIEYITIRVNTEDKTENALFDLRGRREDGWGAIHFLDALPPPISVGFGRGFQQTLTQHVLLYSWGPVDLHICRGSTAVSEFIVSVTGYLVETNNGRGGEGRARRASTPSPNGTTVMSAADERPSCGALSRSG